MPNHRRGFSIKTILRIQSEQMTMNHSHLRGIETPHQASPLGELDTPKIEYRMYQSINRIINLRT